MLELNDYGVISNEVMRSRELSVREKGLYAYLASFICKEDYSFPTVKEIAKELGRNVGTIYNYLKVLKEKNIIKVIPLKDEEGKFINKKYLFNAKYYQNNEMVLANYNHVLYYR